MAFFTVSSKDLYPGESESQQLLPPPSSEALMMQICLFFPLRQPRLSIIEQKPYSGPMQSPPLYSGTCGATETHSGELSKHSPLSRFMLPFQSLPELL